MERRRKRGRTIGFGVKDDRFWGVTIAIEDDESGFAIGEDESVLRLWSRSARRRSRRVKLNGEVEVEQLWALGSISFWVRSLWSELGWPEGCALSLSLLPLSHSHSALSLSVFRKIVFEGKMKTEINLHPTHGQLKTISEKCIFHAQPNTCKYEKVFPEVIFTQNKHSLSCI